MQLELLNDQGQATAKFDAPGCRANRGFAGSIAAGGCANEPTAKPCRSKFGQARKRSTRSGL